MKAAQSQRFFLMSLIVSLALLSSACGEGVRRSGIPEGAQSVLDASIEDIDAGRYEKLYYEAADEWRKDATLDESKATFQKLQDKLGKVRVRGMMGEGESKDDVFVVRTRFKLLGDGPVKQPALQRDPVRPPQRVRVDRPGLGRPARRRARAVDRLAGVLPRLDRRCAPRLGPARRAASADRYARARSQPCRRA